MTNYTPIPKRFEQKYKKLPSGCWEWTGARMRRYGKFWNGHRLMSAHRYSYELYVAPVPKELVVDHLCRNRICVNPAHLEPVTFLENIQRGERATSTHCKRGHEFTKGNTRYRKDRFGRVCITCQNYLQRKRRAA